jgi:hypothetical protein
VPIHKWLICPISALREKFKPFINAALGLTLLIERYPEVLSGKIPDTARFVKTIFFDKINRN